MKRFKPNVTPRQFADMATQLDMEKGITFQDESFTWLTAADAQDVVNMIIEQETVHFLNLGGNTLGVNAAKAIGQALEDHPEFHKALWPNLFNRDLKKKISKVLHYLSAGLIEAKANLTVLDLSNNALGPKGFGGLHQLLKSRVCYSLQELRLRNCNLGPKGAILLANALVRIHGKANGFQLLIFDGGANRLKNAGAKALARAFNVLQTLEEISLDGNLITLSGVEALAKSFRRNTELQRFNLSDNCLKGIGAGEIANILPFLSELRELRMASCKLSTIGAFRIGKKLRISNPWLEVADLSLNKICAVGGRVLVNALHRKSKLRYVNLAGNCFTRKELVTELFSERQNAPNPADSNHSPDDVASFVEEHNQVSLEFKYNIETIQMALSKAIRRPDLTTDEIRKTLLLYLERVDKQNDADTDTNESDDSSGNVYLKDGFSSEEPFENIADNDNISDNEEQNAAVAIENVPGSREQYMQLIGDSLEYTEPDLSDKKSPDNVYLDDDSSKNEGNDSLSEKESQDDPFDNIADNDNFSDNEEQNAAVAIENVPGSREQYMQLIGDSLEYTEPDLSDKKSPNNVQDDPYENHFSDNEEHNAAVAIGNVPGSREQYMQLIGDSLEYTEPDLSDKKSPNNVQDDPYENHSSDNEEHNADVAIGNVSGNRDQLQQLIEDSLEFSALFISSNDVLELAIYKFLEVFDFAKMSNQETCVVECLLEELHLKSSVEPFRTKYDIETAQDVLRELINRPELANDEIKDKLKNYLENVDKENKMFQYFS